MRWSTVWLIFRRELRDQLRDRRTLMMIFVLPMILYPSLSLGIAKLVEAFEDKPRTVVVFGAERLPASPPLLNEARDGFHPGLFDAPAEAGRLKVEIAEAGSAWDDPNYRREAIRDGRADAVVLVPEDIRERLDDLRSDAIPIAYYSAGDRSQSTYLRVDKLVNRWSKVIVDARLAREDKPPEFAEPVRTEAQDVALAAESGATVWARLFPFLLVMMALTGAFYPAIDLCAGEKERGTMETLLISPASRTEIVLGKFFTVMLASMATALLNLASMGITGYRLAGMLTNVRAASRAAAPMIQPPSLVSALWMVVLLIPLAAFFSALCVALAVLARSMKEGQYYITPLYLVSMPLIFVTLAPGVELNLFYSLVPITGVALLLRSLMLGEYGAAAKYFVPVLLPTIFYGWVALQWAIAQFNRESVLFREAERFDLASWLRHLVRDRGPRPTAGEAIVLFLAMLIAAYFTGLYLPMSVMMIPVGLALYVLAPTLALTFLLTSDPVGTLRLRTPRPSYLLAAAGLALAMNPLLMELRPYVEEWFPVSESIKQALQVMMADLPDLGTAVLIFAAVPALFEELAFRGFILSGLESRHRTRSAVELSAVLFGLLHLMIALTGQFVNATLVGLVLGLLAVRSRSLWPSVLLHFLNNAMAVVLPALAADEAHRSWIGWIYRDPEHLLYHRGWVALGAIGSVLLLAWLFRARPAEKTPPATDPAELTG